jgi:MAF protein
MVSDSTIDLVLASNSPRRRELLGLLGWPFRVAAASIDETPLPGEQAQDYVLRLARDKARAVAARVDAGSLGTNSLVLAADTTVVDGGVILGKPADELEAESMLRRLRGGTHQVYTALAALHTSDGMLLTELCATDVPMRTYSDEEIRDYIASGDPLDKAGAYAIQHAGFHPVVGLSGCFANVMGLPLCHLLRLLRRFGLEPEGDLPSACQAKIEYDCKVYPKIFLTQRR